MPATQPTLVEQLRSIHPEQSLVLHDEAIMRSIPVGSYCNRAAQRIENLEQELGHLNSKRPMLRIAARMAMDELVRIGKAGIRQPIIELLSLALNED